MSMARLLRGQVLYLREREFVEAARITGASPWRIIRKELLPNLWSTILVQSTLMLPALRHGRGGAVLPRRRHGRARPPTGAACSRRGASVYQSDITYMFFPGIAMVIFVIAFNLLGDSVRDAFDPKTLR